GHVRALAAPRGGVAAPDAAGGGGAGCVRLERLVAHAAGGVRAGGTLAAAEVRPRRAVVRRRGTKAARLLPRQPAEHLHRPAHPGQAGRGAGTGEDAGRAGMSGVRGGLRAAVPLLGAAALLVVTAVAAGFSGLRVSEVEQTEPAPTGDAGGPPT